MDQELWTSVDRFIGEALIPDDPALDGVQDRAAAPGLPPISVSAAQGKLLMLLARLTGAKRILEVGTLAGYSAIWLARGLSKGGKLVTLELDAMHAEVARDNLKRAKLAGMVEVRVGPALETLPKLSKEKAGPFDLVFIDADKQSYLEYFDWALKLSRKGALIVCDNVVRGGRILEDKPDVMAAGIKRLYERLKNEKRMEATSVQTVGVKGYDGLLFARIR